MAPKKRVYDHDTDVLKAAIDKVKVKGMSYRKAAELHNIPVATLYDKATGKHPLVFCRSLLTKKEEKGLVKWLLELFRFGFTKNSLEIRETAQAIIVARDNNSESEGQTVIPNRSESEGQTVLPNRSESDGQIELPNRSESKGKVELPNRQWLSSFWARHPELPPNTDLRRKIDLITPCAVDLWFQKFHKAIDAIDPSILSSPNRVFNADEMGFQFDTKSKTVKTCKGSKNSYKITSDNSTQVTVLACCNAAGQYIPPLLIYPCKETPTHNLIENFPEALLQLSDNGWITSAFFFSWLKHIFIPSTNHLPKPILLLVDAHTSHTSFLEISPICSQNKIILYCLLPHASDIIQPLNQAFLSTFKPAWSDALKQHVANTGKGVKLESFAGVLKSVWNKVATPEIASDSFEAAGIFPLNPSKISSKIPWLKKDSSKVSKSNCTSLLQVPPEGFISSVALESTSPVLSKSSTSPDPPESTTSPTSCLPLKLEDSSETSSSLALAETSTSHSASIYIVSLDDSTSLVSPEASTCQSSSENPIAAPMTYNDQQVTALKEHSLFICNEMSGGELSMFFSRLANPQTQILFDPLHEKKFQQFEALTRFMVQTFKAPEDLSPKTPQRPDNIVMVPTLKEKEQGKRVCPVATTNLPGRVSGEELKDALKRKLSEKVNRLREKKQRREEKEQRRLFKELLRIEKKKRKEKRARKRAEQEQLKIATLSHVLDGSTDPIVKRDSEFEMVVFEEAIDNLDLINVTVA
uniref:DDE-1 domain-containing protein n=1 Tax=Biomphalaria glabrata TaxID=6526 RepID=A0A2C9KNC9_BIOGL